MEMGQLVQVHLELVDAAGVLTISWDRQLLC